MIKDLVSIVIPTYNDEPHLRAALDDVAAQTYDNVEVIIVNDGSTDNTEEILKEYCKNNKQFSYFNKENGGTGSALNVGFSKANGEFATWFSSDDRKSPEMIEKLVGFLKKNRDVEYVTSAFESQYLKTILRSYIPASNNRGFKHHPFGAPHDNRPSGKSFIVDDWIDINRQQCYQGVNFMFTMRLKNKCGDFLTIPGEDYYMAAQMGLSSRVGYIDLCLGTHQNPPDSLSVQDRSCVAEANKRTWDLIDREHNKWHLKKVPKVAHFYWGSPKMSFLRYMSLRSFKEMNPDWSTILYVPKKLNTSSLWADKSHKCDLSEYDGEDYFSKVKDLPIKVVEVDFSKMFPGRSDLSEVHKSDFLRWYLLHHQGGVWCDMDILFMKGMTEMSINRLENNSLDCSININENHGARIGLMLSSKCNNPFFGEMMELSRQVLSQSENNKEKLLYQSVGAYMVNSFITKSPFVDYIPRQSSLRMQFRNSEGIMYPLFCDNFASREFYYHDHTEIDKIFNKDIFEESYKDSIGIHWYGGSPISQEANNKMTIDNYREFGSTISKAIEKVLGNK